MPHKLLDALRSYDTEALARVCDGYAVVKLRFDFYSTAVRLLIRGH